jgi:hypothetical protein
MTTPENSQPIKINGEELKNENEPVFPFKGMTAAKAAALVSKEVG